MADDEFALLRENADEYAIQWRGAPRVERCWIAVADGHRLSALAWGDAPPRVVLLHGGAQNAHTWDSVALALDLPLVTIDLPGHGHSDWRADHVYDPRTLAADVEVAVRFCLEVAKAFGRGECMFYAAEEFERLVALYGSMQHLQTVPPSG